jgi:Ran GTPase-activating protein (RanGAP) involved in mRNA processing and transport
LIDDTTISKLNLGNNRNNSVDSNSIRNEGTTFIAYALARNKGITELSIRNNGIKAYGALSLSLAFKENKTLRALNIGIGIN